MSLVIDINRKLIRAFDLIGLRSLHSKIVDTIFLISDKINAVYRYHYNDEINFFVTLASKSSMNNFSGSYEVDKFIQLAKGKKNLLDVGALHGFYSMLFIADDQENVRKSLAVEISPIAAKTLTKNIRINCWNKQISLALFGLGKENGIIGFKTRWEHYEIVPSKDATILAPIYTMDTTLFDKNYLPDIIKIDTEGSEYNILLGGRDYLTKHKPALFLEIHPDFLIRNKIKPKQVYDLLLEYGYKVFKCSTDKQIEKGYNIPSTTHTVYAI